MKNYGHRGFSGMYPENTMLSFEKAYEAGADGIELDVHLSSDGEVMIIHDESLERTTGKKGCVYEYKRSELEKIDASLLKPDCGFSPIPSLEEYLAFAKRTGIITNIEIKSIPMYYPGLEKKTLDLVYRFGLEDKVVFSSFNWLSCEIMKALDPKMPTGLLVEGYKLQNLGSAIKARHHEYYHPSFTLIDKDIVEDMHANGVGLNVWTVNEEKDIRDVKALGVDGIISNYPDRVSEILSQ